MTSNTDRIYALTIQMHLTRRDFCKGVTYESFPKLARCPSVGICPTKKFVDTLLQTLNKKY